MKKTHEVRDNQRVNNRKSTYEFSKNSLLLLAFVSFLSGFLWLAAIRFFTVRPAETHYHANFAVYINGVREEFDNSSYYEEIAACSAEYDNNPKGRVHMHEHVNDVIHVHDKRVTYGDFFTNIGWNAGNEALESRDELFVPEGNTKLTYILNGEVVERIDNRLIGNTDRLLISYGDESKSELDEQFGSVGSSAPEVNKKQDPASCSGLNGPGHNSFAERLKHATFWE